MATNDLYLCTHCWKNFADSIQLDKHECQLYLPGMEPGKLEISADGGNTWTQLAP